MDRERVGEAVGTGEGAGAVPAAAQPHGAVGACGGTAAPTVLCATHAAVDNNPAAVYIFARGRGLIPRPTVTADARSRRADVDIMVKRVT